MRSNEDSIDVDSTNAPIIIIGGGPAGAACALGALKKGYDVVLVSYHTYGLRTQRVALRDPLAQNFLLSFIDENEKDDIQFRTKLEKNRFLVSISSIERFLHRKILSTQKLPNSSSAFPVYGNYRNIRREEGVLSSVNPTSKTIIIENDKNEEEIISFKHLIDASGAKHAVFQLAKNSIEALPELYESESLGELPHFSQGTALFSFKPSLIQKHRKYRAIQEKFSRDGKYHLDFTKENIEELKLKFGYNHSKSPTVYIFANREHTKLFVGGEIPGFITKIRVPGVDNAPDKAQEEEIKHNAAVKWFKHMLYLQFGIKAKDLHLIGEKGGKYKQRVKNFIEINQVDKKSANTLAKNKSKLGVTTFELKLTRLKHPIIELSDNAENLLVAVGDALQSPHFHTGTGLVDALNTVDKFIQALPEKQASQQFDLHSYSTYVEKLKRKHKSTIKSIMGTIFLPREEKYQLDALILAKAREKIFNIINKSIDDIEEEDATTLAAFQDKISKRMRSNIEGEQEVLSELMNDCTLAIERIDNILSNKSCTP
jgi:hypothetical protein